MTSSLREIAEREALPDEPDETPGLEPDETPVAPAEGEEEEAAEREPRAPQEGAPPPTEAQIDAMWKALEREATRHAREVEKRAGPMFGDLAPCPLCTVESATPGFIFPDLGEPMQSMRREGIVLALGGSASASYLDDPDAEACERCDALGKLKTGSKVQGQDTRVCTVCNGQGWKPKLAAAPVFTPTVVPPAPAAPQPFAATNGQVPDQWGRLPGQARYGEHPSIGGW